MNMDALKNTLTELNIEESQWQNAMNSKRRIEFINTDKGQFWLKKAAPARGIFRYHALNLFSWMLRLPLLKAVPQPGGNEAIANEINRINKLSSHGICVPEILASGSSWLLIKDVGLSIIKQLKQSDTSQKRRQQLFQACLNAIKSLHLKQQYLSQGFIRNMLLSDESELRIAFIDFEDDPISVMNLAEAQARDVLLLVNSTARFFVQDQSFFQDSIKAFIKGHDQAMITALKTTANRMQWITRIPFQSLFGHDYQKLKVGILALKDI